MRARHTATGLFAALSAAVLLLLTVAAHAQDQGTVREFTVRAHKYAYAPPTIEVQQNDLVKITFIAEDIAHSFTVDSYRIAKRAGVGQSVTFEFRADQRGTFTYYCNLTQDEGCRNMKGQLIVH